MDKLFLHSPKHTVKKQKTIFQKISFCVLFTIRAATNNYFHFSLIYRVISKMKHFVC